MTQVYFIVTECRRYCKIGYSKDPIQRWATLQTGNPLNSFLLRPIEGGRLEESILHSFFEDLQVREGSEWFEVRGALHAYLEMKGLIVVHYQQGTPEQIERAAAIRAQYWDTLSHDDLDWILCEPEVALDVLYDDDSPRVGRGRAVRALFSP